MRARGEHLQIRVCVSVYRAFFSLSLFPPSCFLSLFLSLLFTSNVKTRSSRPTLGRTSLLTGDRNNFKFRRHGSAEIGYSTLRDKGLRRRLNRERYEYRRNYPRASFPIVLFFSLPQRAWVLGYIAQQTEFHFPSLSSSAIRSCPSLRSFLLLPLRSFALSLFLSRKDARNINF